MLGEAGNHHIYTPQDGTVRIRRKPLNKPGLPPISFDKLDNLVNEHASSLSEVHRRRRDAVDAREEELYLKDKKLRGVQRRMRESLSAREVLKNQNEREEAEDLERARRRYHEHIARMPEDGPLQLGLRSPRQRSASLSSTDSEHEKDLPPLPSAEVPQLLDPLQMNPRARAAGAHRPHGHPPQLAAHSIAAANERGNRQPLIMTPIPGSRGPSPMFNHEQPLDRSDESARPTSFRGRFLQPWRRRSPSRAERERIAVAEREGVEPSQRSYFPFSRHTPEPAAQRKTRSWPIVFKSRRQDHNEDSTSRFGMFGRPRKTATV